MKIGYSASCRNTEAFAILVEGWNELVQGGLTPDGDATPPFSASTEALYAATDNGEIIGALSFDTYPGSVVMIGLAYVEVSSRRKQVFASLVDALKRRIGPQGRLIFPVSVYNAQALDVLKKLGIEPETVNCSEVPR